MNAVSVSVTVVAVPDVQRVFAGVTSISSSNTAAAFSGAVAVATPERFPQVPSIILVTEQVPLGKAPFTPLHVHVQVVSVSTTLALPTLQRVAVGSVLELVPSALPHTPGTGSASKQYPVGDM